MPIRGPKDGNPNVSIKSPIRLTQTSLISQAKGGKIGMILPTTMVFMSELPEIFQSDNPELIRRMDRIRENFERLHVELSELESVVLDENYIQGLVNSQSDVIRKPR